MEAGGREEAISTCYYLSLYPQRVNYYLVVCIPQYSDVTHSNFLPITLDLNAANFEATRKVVVKRVFKLPTTLTTKEREREKMDDNNKRGNNKRF